MKSSGMPRIGRWSSASIAGWVVALSLAAPGCQKEAPPDPHVQQGYQLLESDPQAAYDEFGKAQKPADQRVLLGRGLALERLRRYPEAEELLSGIVSKQSDPVAAFSLARVKVVLDKPDEARPLIDQVVGLAPSDLSALLLEACLANDEQRAKKSLEHLDHWLTARTDKTSAQAVPAQFYLAKKSLSTQLRMGADAVRAAEQAKGVGLGQRRGAFALVELAAKSGRRDLAIEILRRINQEAVLPDEKRQVALLSHGLGDHATVGQILEALPSTDKELLTLAAEHEFITGQPQASSSLRNVLASHRADTSARGAVLQARLWQMLALALLRDGQIAEARVETEKMLAQFPSESATVLLARMDLAQGQIQAGLERLQPILAQPQASLEARQLAVMAQLQLGQVDQAKVILESVLREHPSHLGAARLRVGLELEAKKPNDAVRVAEELVARAPLDVGLRLLLAEAENKAKGSQAAVEALRKSVEAVPSDPRLWLALVTALERNKQPADAAAMLEKAHERLPQATMITAALATSWSKQGQTERAANLYETVLKTVQGDPVALNNLAMLYLDELGNVERGVELAEQAHQIAQVPGIVDTLGWALFKRGQPDDLKRAKQLLTSVQGKLTSPTFKYHLGAVLVATGEINEGRQMLRQALAQSDGFAEAEQARLLLAQNQ